MLFQDELVRYFKRPRRTISKQKRNKKVESESTSMHSDDSIDMHVDTDKDADQPTVNNESMQNNEEIMHRDESNNSSDSPATNEETQQHSDSELVENVDIDSNGANEEILNEKTIDHSFESGENNPFENNDSLQLTPEREISPVDPLSPPLVYHSDAPSTPLPSQNKPKQQPQLEIERKVIPLYGVSGSVETFGSSIIITIKGNTDEQRRFTFQSENEME